MEATEPRVPICYARKFCDRHHDLANCYGISVSHMITYMFHVSTSRSFPHSWSFKDFVTRVKGRVSLVDQELIIIICKSKDRQHNGQRKKNKNDTQWSTKHYTKTKVRVTQTPLKTGGDIRCCGRVSASCSTIGNRFIFIG
jgi:hypothetical protein